MKKLTALVTVVIFAFSLVGFSSPAEAAGHRVKAKVCAKQYKHWGSKKFIKCKKQGWHYERGIYPMYDQVNDVWIETPYILVYSPKGRLRLDTTGLYSTPNVR